MQKWQYRKIEEHGYSDGKLSYRLDGTLMNGREGHTITDLLNASGQDGWEVVGVSESEEGVTYILKRPV